MHERMTDTSGPGPGTVSASASKFLLVSVSVSVPVSVSVAVGVEAGDRYNGRMQARARYMKRPAEKGMQYTIA